MDLTLEEINLLEDEWLKNQKSEEFTDENPPDWFKRGGPQSYKYSDVPKSLRDLRSKMEKLEKSPYRQAKWKQANIEVTRKNMRQVAPAQKSLLAAASKSQ